MRIEVTICIDKDSKVTLGATPAKHQLVRIKSTDQRQDVETWIFFRDLSKLDELMDTLRVLHMEVHGHDDNNPDQT
jgi:hypothetical protein